MREMGQQISPKDVKYVFNSLISAVDFTQMPQEEKTDIINKINSSGNNNAVNEFDHEDPMENPVWGDARFRASGGSTVGERITKHDLLKMINEGTK